MEEMLRPFYNYLDTISNRGVKPGLKRISEALRLLGSPQKSCKIIHVAGTNGKGSVCSLTAQLLAVSGHRVGLTLSPHVRDWRERAQHFEPGDAAPRLIPERQLLHVHETMLAKIPDALGLTYFEWSIALALKYFSDIGVDFAVLETGMGGRWDATNVCDSLVSAIPTVGLDHMAQLGNTPEAILEEKIRIVKPDSDFLFGPTEPSLVNIAKEYCTQAKASFHAFGEMRARLEKRTRRRRDYFSKKPAWYYDNFIFAIGLGELIAQNGTTVDFQTFCDTPAYHFPPARFATISEKPLIILDGAHNEPALSRLAEFCRRHWSQGYELVFGCLNDRDFLALADIIRSPLGRNFWLEFPAGNRTTPPETLERAVVTLDGVRIAMGDELRDNLRMASRPVLVCGSLYLCSLFEKFWRYPYSGPKTRT